MYADRYRRQPLSPSGLTAAAAISAALVAAILTAAPTILPPVERVLEGRNIPIVDPPPPKPVEREIIEDVRTASAKPVVPDPIVDTPIASDPVTVTTIIDPPLPSLPDTGGTGTVVVDPPKPAPVIVQPQVDPRYAGDLQPEYPPDMRRQDREGRVTVRVLIGTDGRVKAIEPVASASDSFFAATRRQALARWRFKPATRDGAPFEAWRTMTLTFRLTE